MTLASERARAPDVPRISPGSLTLTATVMAVAASTLDLAGRLVAVSAVPALLSLQLTGALIVVLAAALRVRTGLDVRVPKVRAWQLPTALVAAVAVVLVRIGTTPNAPTVAWFAPIVLVAPAALASDLFLSWRAGGRPGRAVAVRAASVWCVVAALWMLVTVIGPARWGNVDLKPIVVRAGSWSIVAVAAAIAVLVVRHAPRVALRFAAVTVAGLAGATTVAGLSESGGRWWAALSAATVLFLIAVPDRAWIAVAGKVRDAAHGGSARSRRVVRALAVRRGRLAGAVRRARRRRPARPVVRPAERPSLGKADRVGVAVMGVASVVYLAAGLAWARRVGWQPTGHAASIMARAYDVGTAHHPLVGMITSLGAEGGASHPGPLALDVLAPLVRTLGMQHAGMTGGVIVAATCWCVAVWSAWRAAGRTAAVAAWVTGAIVIEIAALGAVWEANTVSITMLAMFAALLASWAAASGVWRAWWWAVGLGTLCAQSYLPHALIVIGPVLWSGLVVARARASSDPAEARAARRALWIGAAVAVVTWAQPVLDVVMNEGGNVRALGEQVVRPNPNVGPAGFGRAVAWIFAVPPRWREITGSFSTAGTAMDFLGGSLVPGTVVALLVGVWWWRTRRSSGLRVRQARMVTLLVVIGAGVNASQLPREHLRSFQVGWIVVASIWVWFAVGVDAGFALRQRLPALAAARFARPMSVGGFGLCVALVLATGVSVPGDIEDVKGRPFAIDDMVDPIVEQAVSGIDHEERLLVLGLDSTLNQVNTDTIVSNLIVQGIDVAVEPGVGAHYGPRRLAGGGWSGPMLWVTSGTSPVKPVGTRIAAATMPNWSQSRFDSLAAEVGDRLRSAPSVDLASWVLPLLPRYLSGWIEDGACTVADQIRRGEYVIGSLPDGLLLTLYGDMAITSPRLAPEVQAEASGLIGQSPLEVWQVERRSEGPIASDRLLRDGSQCPVQPELDD